MIYFIKINKIFTLIAVTFGFMFSTTTFADHEPKEQMSVQDSFKVINQRLYELEETKSYCNLEFSRQVSRNNEAYDQWELQNNFFLREFDKNYAKWKSGFNDLEQQQFSTLEFIEREHVKNKIIADYEEGSEDKCYNYKPSLSRPRNNIELSEQESINLIRNNAMNSFTNDRDKNGANSQCAWEQNHSIKTIELRDSGKDAKAQKLLLKAMKKAKNNLDKKTKSKQASSYSQMIGEVYLAPTMTSLTYSQYRFALCERDLDDIPTQKFKKITSLLLNCQSTSANDPDLLGSCVNQVMNK